MSDTIQKKKMTAIGKKKQEHLSQARHLIARGKASAKKYREAKAKYKSAKKALKQAKKIAKKDAKAAAKAQKMLKSLLKRSASKKHLSRKAKTAPAIKESIPV